MYEFHRIDTRTTYGRNLYGTHLTRQVVEMLHRQQAGDVHREAEAQPRLPYEHAVGDMFDASKWAGGGIAACACVGAWWFEKMKNENCKRRI